jgi:hypothetical protein
MSSFPTCPECGYVHPPEPPGECRVAKGVKIKEDLEARGLSKLYELTEKVKQDICIKYKDTDPAKLDPIIAKIRNFINNM